MVPLSFWAQLLGYTEIQLHLDDDDDDDDDMLWGCYVGTGGDFINFCGLASRSPSSSDDDDDDEEDVPMDRPIVSGNPATAKAVTRLIVSMTDPMVEIGVPSVTR